MDTTRHPHCISVWTTHHNDDTAAAAAVCTHDADTDTNGNSITQKKNTHTHRQALKLCVAQNWTLQQPTYTTDTSCLRRLAFEVKPSRAELPVASEDRWLGRPNRWAASPWEQGTRWWKVKLEANPAEPPHGCQAGLQWVKGREAAKKSKHVSQLVRVPLCRSLGLCRELLRMGV